MILSSSRRDPERERRNVKHLLERSTDGLILGAPQCPPEELAEMAQRADVPMVFLNREVKGPRVAAVWIDWPTATTEVVTYLAGLGHRRIALVVPSRSDARVGNREDWYRPALARAGLGPERALIFRDAMSLEGGHAAGQRLLAAEPRPTAAICHNDVMAIGLLQACAEHRVRVPEDLSIVGWDDVPVREPRHAPAHHRARAPVRARPGRGAKAARADGRPTRRRGAEPPLALELVVRRSSRPPGGGPSRVRERGPRPPSHQPKEERGERAVGRRACRG